MNPPLSKAAMKWCREHASKEQMRTIDSLSHDSVKALDYIRGISPEAAATLQEMGAAPHTMTIRTDGFPDQLIHDQLVNGGQGRWRPLGEVAKEEIAARMQKLIDDNTIVPAPDVEFEEDKELLWKAGLL